MSKAASAVDPQSKKRKQNEKKEEVSNLAEPTVSV
jgi:hypothetical protein